MRKGADIQFPIRLLGYNEKTNVELHTKLCDYYDSIFFYARRIILDNDFTLNNEVLLNEIYNSSSYYYSVYEDGSATEVDILHMLNEALTDIKYYADQITVNDALDVDLIVHKVSIDTITAKSA